VNSLRINAQLTGLLKPTVVLLVILMPQHQESSQNLAPIRSGATGYCDIGGTGKANVTAGRIGKRAHVCVPSGIAKDTRNCSEKSRRSGCQRHGYIRVPVHWCNWRHAKPAPTFRGMFAAVRPTPHGPAFFSRRLANVHKIPTDSAERLLRDSHSIMQIEASRGFA
jgi:hypothetical protein